MLGNTHLIGLGTCPDDGGDRATDQGDIYTSLTEGGPGKHRKVYTIQTTDVAVRSIGQGNQEMAQGNSPNSSAR